MKMRVRKALVSDLGALIDLSRRTISASYRPFLGDEAVDTFLGSGAADRFVQENLDCCTVVERDGQVIGYAVYRDNRIDLLMIDPSFHRQGLGTELLHQVEATLGHRYEELWLESFAMNEPANASYRKNGWREVSRHFDNDAGVPKIVFRKATGLTERSR